MGPVRRGILVVLLFGIFLQAAAATGHWSITDATVYPEKTNEGAPGVAVMHVEDWKGDPVAPWRCHMIQNQMYYGDPINATEGEDYVNNWMTYTYGENPDGWFFNDTFRFDSAINQQEIRFSAYGVCEGEESEDTAVEYREVDMDGDIWVRFPEDNDGNVIEEYTPQDTYWENETIDIAVNATRPAGRGEAFIEDGNYSFTLYDISGDVVRHANVHEDDWADNIRVMSDRVEVEIPLQGSGDVETVDGGHYVLSVTAHNRTLDVPNVETPYGGLAVPITVIPSFLEGRSWIETPTPPADEDVDVLDYPCREQEVTVGRRGGETAEIPVCEKDFSFDVYFEELYAEADTVKASVTGAVTGDVFETIELERMNETHWNGSFHIPKMFDTEQYGQDLVINVSAGNQFQSVEEAHLMQISGFDIRTTTSKTNAPLGESVDLVAGPISNFTRSEISNESIARVDFTVTHENDVLHEETLERPFSSNYRRENAEFYTRYSVPYTAPTGDHTVNVSMTDIYGVEATTQFDFPVVEPESTDRPVVVLDKQGDHMYSINNLSSSFNTTGVYDNTIALYNVGGDPAQVDIEPRGGIADITAIRNSSHNLHSGQLQLVTISFKPDDSGTHTGHLHFEVGGAEIAPYNITLPVSLDVECNKQVHPFCITDTNLEQEVTTAGEHTLSFTARNTGDWAPSLQIDVMGQNITQLMEEVHHEETIAVGNSSTVEIPYQVGTFDNGVHTGSLNLFHQGTTSDEEVYLNVSIDVAIDTGRIAATASQTELGTFVEGDQIPVNLTILNNGTRTINTVTLDSENLDISGETVDVHLTSQEETTITHTGTAIAGTEEATIEVNPDAGSSDTVTVTFTVYTDYTDDIDALREDLNEVGSTIQQLPAEDREPYEIELSNTRELLNASESAWENGRYEDTEEYYRDAELSYEELDQNVADAVANADQNQNESSGGDGGESPDEGSGFGLPIMAMAVILIIIVVVAVILYFSLVPEEEEDIPYR